MRLPVSRRSSTGSRRRLCAESWAATGRRLARPSAQTPSTGAGRRQRRQDRGTPARQSVRLKRNRRATGQRRRLCAQSWTATGQRRRLCAQSWAATGQRLARQSIRTPLTGTGAAQTAARSWRGGMIDLIEQWNNNTHIGVCVCCYVSMFCFCLYGAKSGARIGAGIGARLGARLGAKSGAGIGAKRGQAD